MCCFAGFATAASSVAGACAAALETCCSSGFDGCAFGLAVSFACSGSDSSDVLFSEIAVKGGNGLFSFRWTEPLPEDGYDVLNVFVA